MGRASRGVRCDRWERGGGEGAGESMAGAAGITVENVHVAVAGLLSQKPDDSEKPKEERGSEREMGGRDKGGLCVCGLGVCKETCRWVP